MVSDETSEFLRRNVMGKTVGADEAIVPHLRYLSYPTLGGTVIENRINWSFARLLTPTLTVTLDSGRLHQNWPVEPTSGFDKTSLGLKYEAYRDNQHESLISLSFAWGIAHSASAAVGTDVPSTVQPGEVSVIFPIHCRGSVRLQSPGSWSTKNPSVREGERLRPISRH
jgi:hypothetical protein